MESRSKVFPRPVSVGGPAGAGPAPGRRASLRGQLLGLAALLGQLGSACRLSSQDLSDICFVSGVTTAILGALVAISGVFTRNQVSLRARRPGQPLD